MVKAVVHVHSGYSYDSLNRIKGLLNSAARNGVQVLAITDHGTIKGSVEAAKLAKRYGVDCIIGAEYHTDCGDIIGLFLREEIVSKNVFEVIKEIKQQGGLVILPHPYYHHSKIEEIAPLCDCIEVFNARCSLDENDRARALAERLRKPITVGPDAHLIKELTNAVMEYQYEGPVGKDMFLQVKPITFIRNADIRDVFYSQMIKGIKLIKPLLVIRQVYNLLKHKLSN